MEVALDPASGAGDASFAGGEPGDAGALGGEVFFDEGFLAPDERAAGACPALEEVAVFAADEGEAFVEGGRLVGEEVSEGGGADEDVAGEGPGQRLSGGAVGPGEEVGVREPGRGLRVEVGGDGAGDGVGVESESGADEVEQPVGGGALVVVDEGEKGRSGRAGVVARRDMFEVGEAFGEGAVACEGDAGAGFVDEADGEVGVFAAGVVDDGGDGGVFVGGSVVDNEERHVEVERTGLGGRGGAGVGVVEEGERLQKAAEAVGSAVGRDEDHDGGAHGRDCSETGERVCRRASVRRGRRRFVGRAACG